MSFADLAKRALDSRAVLFEEYKTVGNDTKLSSTEKRERLKHIGTALDEKGEEVKDFVAKAEAEAESRKLSRKMPGLIGSSANPLDPEDRGWATGDGFTLPSGREWQAHMESRDISTALSSAGVAVPTGVYADFVTSLRQKSSFLASGINLLPMSEGILNIPVVTADGSATVVAEGAQIPKSDLSFGNAGFNSYKVAELVAVTSEMFEDSAADVRRAVANALIRNTALTVDNLLYNGTGSGQPLGILNVAGITSTSLSAAVTLDNLADEMTQIEAYGGTVTSILTDPATFSVIRKLKSSGSGQYFSSPFVATDGPNQVWGARLAAAQKLPSGTVILMDNSQVYAGLRRQVQLMFSGEFYFDTDKLGARITSRWAGVGVADLKAVRILKKTVNGT